MELTDTEISNQIAYLTRVKSTLKRAVHNLSVSQYHPIMERQAEIVQIKNFIVDSKCYISHSNTYASHTLQLFGLPGSGKSMAVHKALNEIMNSVKLKKQVNMSSLLLNGYAMQNTCESFVILLKHLLLSWNAVNHPLYAYTRDNDTSITSKTAQLVLTQYFDDPVKWAQSYVPRSSNKYTVPLCVIVLDEVDKCYERDHVVFFKLLDWISKQGSHCRLITIANTMHLPLKLDNKIRSRLDQQQKIVFAPYTANQLRNILHQRIYPAHFNNGTMGHEPIFTKGAENQLCNQIAKTHGDVRRLLQTAATAVHSGIIKLNLRRDYLAKISNLRSLKNCNDLTNSSIKVACVPEFKSEENASQGIIDIKDMFKFIRCIFLDTSIDVINQTDNIPTLLILTALVKHVLHFNALSAKALTSYNSSDFDHTEDSTKEYITLIRLFAIVSKQLIELKSSEFILENIRNVLEKPMTYSEFLQVLDPLVNLQLIKITTDTLSNSAPHSSITKIDRNTSIYSNYLGYNIGKMMPSPLNKQSITESAWSNDFLVIYLLADPTALRTALELKESAPWLSTYMH